jgi:hypothetical protein
MAAKNWGPFSGHQLTIIVTAAILVLTVPGTAVAVDAFSNVAIEDPVTGVKATVDSTHHVLMGTSRPLAPTSPWRASQDTVGSYAVLAGPSTTAINITNLAVSHARGGGLVLVAYRTTNATCDQTVDTFSTRSITFN